MSTQADPIAPDNLDTYWDAIDAELAAIPAAPEAEPLALHSTGHSTTWRVRLTSIGPWRIEAFLSIPDGEGPFPALFLAPAYGSVVMPPSYDDRMRYVAMSVRYRGTRGAGTPRAAAFPGLLTEGIAEAGTWSFRGILADALRAFEYLAALPIVDPVRIAVTGSDLGLVVAARRPGVRAVAMTAPLLYRLAEAYPATEAYPFEEINDHLRGFPAEREAVDRTLALFDPLHHAPAITADVLLVEGDPGTVGGPEWLAPLARALGGAVERHALTHEGQTDYDAIDRWLAGKQGVPPRPRTWATDDIGPWQARREA